MKDALRDRLLIEMSRAIELLLIEPVMLDADDRSECALRLAETRRMLEREQE